MPFQSAAGTKRSQWDAGSTSAVNRVRVPVGTAVQLDPSAEYCQAPSVALARFPRMATPDSAVAFGPSAASL